MDWVGFRELLVSLQLELVWVLSRQVFNQELEMLWLAVPLQVILS